MKINYDKLIFEIGRAGRRATRVPDNWTGAVLSAEDILGQGNTRAEDAKLVDITEAEAVRHYTLLSNKNFGVDTGFYPLGSCTMKYNPKINEDTASLPGFTELHPLQDESETQGALELMYNLQNQLSEISGMPSFTLQPAAGSHGEMTGLMIIKAYHEKNGESHRDKIIVPDSAHGTNPASVAVVGYKTVIIKSNDDGSINLDALKEAIDKNEGTIAGFMLTNPSTLGLFEINIEDAAKMVHQAGGLLYYDGANLNAIMGIVRPGDMGFDVMHINLHKTFSTPHGGGGPGAGPVGVVDRLKEFLPVPIIEKSSEGFTINYNKPESIGKIKGFYGNFGILVRAYTYILTMGGDGLKKASMTAVLNANYLKQKLKGHYNLPVDRNYMHEFVLAGVSGCNGLVPTLDVAKRLLDYGYHPPTVYFPLIIDQAIMIEPTETESLETLDAFVEVMIKIAEEAKSDPELLHNAPYDTVVRRVDEVLAATKLTLKYSDIAKG